MDRVQLERPRWDRTNNEWKYYVSQYSAGGRRPPPVRAESPGALTLVGGKPAVQERLQSAGWCPAPSAETRPRRRPGAAPPPPAPPPAAGRGADADPVVLDLSRPGAGPERLGVVFMRVSEFFPKGHFDECKGGKMIEGAHLRMSELAGG